ncbi:hypothetical protein [Spirosoma montaniterrae]|uniref:Uncharacterized protein n=1 Tax=Spirosoma montaniterrae TaxID=1178516 RepID=A0A1P9X2M9_9BACT|nr:hypothetical protein [Spirosoma montaniterrae]AQG81887.1 hypothetical protein AWR27_22860 [Spirosoma montaniterrae]
MNDRDKQRLDELELKTALLMARQDEQEAKLQQLALKLAYIEARQHRILKELGMPADQVDSLQAALDDARALNLITIPQQRWN